MSLNLSPKPDLCEQKTDNSSRKRKYLCFEPFELYDTKNEIGFSFSGISISFLSYKNRLRIGVTVDKGVIRDGLDGAKKIANGMINEFKKMSRMVNIPCESVIYRSEGIETDMPTKAPDTQNIFEETDSFKENLEKLEARSSSNHMDALEPIIKDRKIFRDKHAHYNNNKLDTEHSVANKNDRNNIENGPTKNYIQKSMLRTHHRNSSCSINPASLISNGVSRS